MSFFERNKPSFVDRDKPGLLDRDRSYFDGLDDPDLEPSEDDALVTVDGVAMSEDEIPAKLRAFRDRNKAEQARFDAAKDTEVWVAVVFSNRADKDAFIAEFGMIDHPMIPGMPGNKYVNGYTFAAALRARLEPVDE